MARVGLRDMAALATAGVLATASLMAAGSGAGAQQVVPTGPARRAVTAAAGPAAEGPVLHEVWRVQLGEGLRGAVMLGSPSIATLKEGAAVVFGDRSGRVDALSLASGASVPGWPKHLGVPVTSTPSVLKTPGSPYDTVLVGSGDAADPCAGGYEWLLPSGAVGFASGPNPSADHACRADGVFAGVAIGTLGGVTAAVAGTLGQETYAFDAVTRRVLAGFPWFQGDSNFATPAIADVDGDGTNQIIEGGAQTAGVAFGRKYTQGGHIRVLSASGKLLCEETTNESVNSSPAVGTFLANAAVGIVAGTGPTFPTAREHDDVIAVNAHCHEVWAHKLAGTTGYESPALADVLGNGQLQVVVTTRSGGVYAFEGANGATLWHTQLKHHIYGSPVTIGLGTGPQDVVVATTGGFDVLTGERGRVLDA
ncbi:MAG: PQQ-binding-like beta-propeller repeat protein, partial [Acidimicrobiales bacterium]